MKSRDKAKINEVAATLPTDRATLLQEAAEAVAALNSAVLEGDDDAADAAADRYDAAVIVLNGGTFFGCMDRNNPDAGGILAENHCRAEPGTVPSWGQNGEFMITVSGIRAVVVVKEGFSRLCYSFEFHAVDADRPFISETGFKSHYEDARGGMTVDQVARAVFTAYLETDRTSLEKYYRDRVEQWTWLDTSEAPALAALSYVESDGQMSLGL